MSSRERPARWQCLVGGAPTTVRILVVEQVTGRARVSTRTLPSMTRRLWLQASPRRNTVAPAGMLICPGGSNAGKMVGQS